MLLFSSVYNEYTVISKEYTGPLDFDITGVDCKLSGQKYLYTFKLCHMVEICMPLMLFLLKITSNVLIYLTIG